MPDKICSVDECERPVVARGWCKRHWSAWRRNGTTESQARKRGQCSIDECERPTQARGWCTLHYDRWRRNGDPLITKFIVGDDEARFWAKVDRRGDNECWPWLGAHTNGYAVFSWSGGQKAHRFAYELLVGPIPEGLVIDHVRARGCVRRDCTNPQHLEAVTNSENVKRGDGTHRTNARKTHCIHGHELTQENTYIDPSGGRNCRTCKRERDSARRQRSGRIDCHV